MMGQMFQEVARMQCVQNLGRQCTVTQGDTTLCQARFLATTGLCWAALGC